MLQCHWNSIDITTNQQANDMVKLFQKIKPRIGADDSETNGLHIILSKPFVYQFGFIDSATYEGYTYLVDIEKQPQLARQVIKVWQELAKTLEVYLGHNKTFDMHMLTNIGLPYTTENMSDTMFYIRYAHDALAPKNGGPPLALKDYAAQYIDHKAKAHDKLLQAERTAIAKDLNIRLKQKLKNCGTPPAKYGAKSWTLSVLDQFFKDPIADYNDLPEHVRQCYLEWLHEDVPLYLQHEVTGLIDSTMIPYNILNRKNLYKYAHYDIIYTIEIYLKLAPIVHNRHNEIGIDFENQLIMPIYEMERVGFAVDKEYIETCRINMKRYIQKRRQTLWDLAGQEFDIGQYAIIKSILNNDFNLNVTTTNADELDLLRSNLIRERGFERAVQFIEIVQELRTLEKWYSTYIMRFLKDLKYCDRLYTTINQVGAVSGRVTSNFQQFPKHAIKTIDGEELFHPRKMIKITGDEYDAIVYLDFSQIELRFQAFYTILVGHPDFNLCRAYMPYQCINSNGDRFDFNNPEHILSWDAEWFLEESKDVRWCPTDVHGATTMAATGLGPDHPDFKDLRNEIGKPTNFAKNYGAQLSRIRQMFPTKSEEEVRRINDAYYTAFPGVKFYHQYCYDRALQYSHTTNLFGIKYYGVSGHKLINLLIQGSSAYYLKWKIRQLYDYWKEKGYKSRWQMQIHDELSWEKHKNDSPEIFFEYQQIMQDWPETKVPIVAEMDVTTTTWAEKKGVHSLDELRIYLSS